MKKLVKVFGIILAMCIVLSFAACGNDGTYTAKSFELKMGPTTISINADEATEEELAIYGEFFEMKIEVKGDEMILWSGDEEMGRYKFKKDGDKIVPLDDDGNEEPMEVDGITAAFYFEGKQLIMEMGEEGKSVKVVFEK